MKIFTTTITAVFGETSEVHNFSTQEEANAFIVKWDGGRSGETNASDILSWYSNNSEEVDYTIALFETEMQAPQHQVVLTDEMISLLKATAIGTYTSNGEDEDDYDSLMAANDFDDIPDLTLWEPFEDYPIENIKENVENEFDSLCSVVKKSIEMYHG